MAQWKPVKGYEELYLVSDEGEVVSLPRTIATRNGTGEILVHRAQRVLKCHPRGNKGSATYYFVALSKNGKTERVSIHRVVAEAFLPNPDNLPEVNHKDKNPKNNRVDNLEWCTRLYNARYSKNKPIVQMLNGEIVGKHDSAVMASEKTGIKRRSITNALKGWSKTAGGYQWSYAK